MSERIERIEEAVEHLIRREETLEVFLNASPWGIIVVDPTFHLVYINKTFERMSGYRVDEITGQHLHTLMPEPDRSIHRKHEIGYIKAPKDRMGNHGLHPRLLCKNGSVLDIEVSLSPTRIHGQRYFFASIRPIESLFNTVEGRVKGS